MSEDPIVKHALKTYRAVINKRKPLPERLGEILAEVLIIVFAVSLSFTLEHWRDNSKKNEIEHEFFVGYKKDLISDIKELKSDSSAYHDQAVAFAYFLHNEKYNVDSVKAYYHWFYSSMDFFPNVSRFEALKASGNLDVVKNKELLDHIISLYSETIPSLTNGTKNFTNLKLNFFHPFLRNNLRADLSNIEQVLHTDIGKNYLNTRVYASNYMSQYHEVIVKAQKIVADVEAEEKK